MGYSRGDALAALEKYDYNLERVSSITTTNPAAAAVVVSPGSPVSPRTGMRKKGMRVV
jgi:hypothetical protein